MNKLTIVDGNSFLFRAYYATARPGLEIMRTKDGVPTNAVFAFANMLTKLMAGLKEGDGLFVGFDADSQTFRKEEFAAYKANRKPCPEDLKAQFPLARELCAKLGILCYEEHGVEADDLCGTLAKLASKKGVQVEIYTSDKDYLQLIDENVSVNLLKVGLSNMERVTASNMRELYGFSPLQIIDYKGLRGDASDNLPGIPGVGEKTAVKLIAEYGSFEKIVEAAPSIKGKLGENLLAYKDQGYESYRLATIRTDLELPFGLDDVVYKGYETPALGEFANRYELKQLLNRVPGAWAKKGIDEAKIETVASFKELELPTRVGLALDIDYSSYHDSEVAGIAIAYDGKAYYLANPDLENDRVLRGILENEGLKKAVYDRKAIEYACLRHDIALKGVEDDLLLAAYLLESAAYQDPGAVYRSFGAEIGEPEPTLWSGKGADYTGRMSHFALLLAPKAEASLKSIDAYKLYKEIELPLSHVLAQMEFEGFPVSKETLLKEGASFVSKRDEAARFAHALLGHEINLNSPKQVADALYKERGLPDKHRGGTSVEALKELKELDPFVSFLLEYRKYAKLVGTYIEGLTPHIGKDGKIHTYFNQALTATGRLSSKAPNLQNISERDEEGKKIKNAFYYEDPDIEIVSMDYHQIELRILAAASNSPSYIEVFSGDRDIHMETARLIFHTDAPTPAMRRQAKAVNFAVIYGTTVYGLSEQIGCSPKEAGEIISRFYEAYPEVGAYLQKLLKSVESQGFVSTMFGRRRYLREIGDPSYAKREAARRAALNAPIQGSAADLIKKAMVEIDKALSEGEYRTKMVLQVHDELLFAMPKDEEDKLIPLLKNIMESCVKLPVKLSVEVGKGRRWSDAKE